MYTTNAAVAQIIDVDTTITGIDSSGAPDLSAFIASADMLVQRVCANPNYPNAANSAVYPTYSDVELELIERWLAAHFYAIRDPRYQSEGIGGANATIQGQTAMNLSGTQYGQMALILDFNGGLARLSEHVAKGKRGRPMMSHLGHRVKRWGWGW